MAATFKAGANWAAAPAAGAAAATLRASSPAHSLTQGKLKCDDYKIEKLLQEEFTWNILGSVFFFFFNAVSKKHQETSIHSWEKNMLLT